jgi:hypothetical protein
MAIFLNEEKVDQEKLSGPQVPSSEDPNFPLEQSKPVAYSIYRMQFESCLSLNACVGCALRVWSCMMM